MAELDEAMEWLSRESNWAPGQFLAEYNARIAQIKERPDSFRFAYKSYRRLNLKRFNYAILFRVRSNDIFIIAIMHQRRHPDYWKHRIDDAPSTRSKPT